MNTEILKQYAEIKRQIVSLQDQESILKQAVMSELENNNLKKAETAYGKFTIATRRSYIYSGKIEILEDKLKIAKLTEQEKGIAGSKETNYLIFT